MQDLSPSQFTTSSILQRYIHINAALDRFWKRLITELTPQLRAFKKWTGLKRNVRVGDVGVLVDPGFRNVYKLARVIEVFPSRDGLVRRLRLKTAESIFERNVTHFAIILEAERTHIAPMEPEEKE